LSRHSITVTQHQETLMATWQDRAQRGLTLFEGDSTGEGDRTWQVFNHVLDEDHLDDHISRDFFNVQQTAGGLPPDLSFEQFLSAISGHVRSELEGSSFAEDLGDEDFRTAALTFDDNIRRHIRFLNGVVHQAAPSDVHRQLWDLILSARGDDRSIYSCYREFLVDA
jgi:hypothetical protein